MKERSAWHEIPIYGVHLQVVVTDDICRSHRKKKYLGDFKDCDAEICGLCSWCGPVFVIFLERERGTTHGTIAHEAFHCTHRILERAGCDIGPDHHEAHAHLISHLVHLIYKDLRKWRVKVKP